MPLQYKIDILSALKQNGYNTTKLRKEKLLSEGVIQSLREKNQYHGAISKQFADSLIVSLEIFCNLYPTVCDTPMPLDISVSVFLSCKEIKKWRIQ